MLHVIHHYVSIYVCRTPNTTALQYYIYVIIQSSGPHLYFDFGTFYNYAEEIVDPVQLLSLGHVSRPVLEKYLLNQNSRVYKKRDLKSSKVWLGTEFYFDEET